MYNTEKLSLFIEFQKYACLLLFMYYYRINDEDKDVVKLFLKGGKMFPNLLVNMYIIDYLTQIEHDGYVKHESDFSEHPGEINDEDITDNNVISDIYKVVIADVLLKTQLPERHELQKIIWNVEWD